MSLDLISQHVKVINALFKSVAPLPIFASARKGKWDKGLNDGFFKILYNFKW